MTVFCLFLFFFSGGGGGIQYGDGEPPSAIVTAVSNADFFSAVWDALICTIYCFSSNYKLEMFWTLVFFCVCKFSYDISHEITPPPRPPRCIEMPSPSWCSTSIPSSIDLRVNDCRGVFWWGNAECRRTRGQASCRAAPVKVQARSLQSCQNGTEPILGEKKWQTRPFHDGREALSLEKGWRSWHWHALKSPFWIGWSRRTDFNILHRGRLTSSQTNLKSCSHRLGHDGK